MSYTNSENTKAFYLKAYLLCIQIDKEDIFRKLERGAGITEAPR